MDVILDIEVALNSRPLSYLEDDVEQPVLTLTKLLQIKLNDIPKVQLHHLHDVDLRKRAKFLRKCKELMWRLWS